MQFAEQHSTSRIWQNRTSICYFRSRMEGSICCTTLHSKSVTTVSNMSSRTGWISPVVWYSAAWVLTSQRPTLESLLSAAAIIGESFALSDIHCLTGSAMDELNAALRAAAGKTFCLARRRGAVSRAPSCIANFIGPALTITANITPSLLSA